MSITPDTAAEIVASILRADSATAYVPTDTRYGVVVIPDETWIGAAHVAHVRIDGLGTHGHVTGVEIQTSTGVINADTDSSDPAARLNLPARIRDAINAIINA